jgi:hypothetical protein
MNTSARDRFNQSLNILNFRNTHLDTFLHKS